jgi:hypothetical protein
MSRPKKKPNEKKDLEYNGWMFSRDFSNGIFNLINSGKIFPAFGLLLILIGLLIVWRAPPSGITIIINDAYKFLYGGYFLVLILLVVSNVFWFILNKKQRELYDKEILRLSSIRSDLLHKGNPPILETHRSSDGEQLENYLLPGLPQDGGK